MKNSNDTIGNRTRDLLACSAVPQPTAPPRAPNSIVTDYNLWVKTKREVIAEQDRTNAVLLVARATGFRIAARLLLLLSTVPTHLPLTFTNVY
jgi:hypothetical protein